jgi:hypothetical protein
MNPGLRAGTLELISPRSSLKRVADADESSAISYEQCAADHSDLLEIYQELQFAELLLIEANVGSYFRQKPRKICRSFCRFCKRSHRQRGCADSISVRSPRRP